MRPHIGRLLDGEKHLDRLHGSPWERTDEVEGQRCDRRVDSIPSDSVRFIDAVAQQPAVLALGVTG